MTPVDSKCPNEPRKAGIALHTIKDIKTAVYAVVFVGVVAVAKIDINSSKDESSRNTAVES
jgi:hypothetical protein